MPTGCKQEMEQVARERERTGADGSETGRPAGGPGLQGPDRGPKDPDRAGGPGENKSILTMERACALLEQKKITTAMEERQVIDKLWDTYGLTPTTAASERAELESVGRATAELQS
mgnify:CR=1 FL=1